MHKVSGTELLRYAPDVVFISNAHGQIVFANDQASEVLGYSFAELLAMSVLDISPPDWRERYRLSLKQALSDNQRHVFEIRLITKSGRKIPMELLLVSMPNGQLFGSCRDITERKVAEQNIHTLAFYDPLTKLPNRRFLLSRIAQLLTVSTEQQRYGALLFVDLDHFKAFKAVLGDAVLSQVAHRLQNIMQANYGLACLGGDAFVIVIEPFCTELKIAADHAEMLARKISSTIRQSYLINSQELRTSASIGIVLFYGLLESPEELLKQAKSALDAAKKAGRNTYKFYNPELQALLAARNALEHELRTAIEQQQLTLHYQIQVNSQARPVGVEVLARWHHPQHGMIPPTEFIPLSEETGLIVPLGLWVLEQACKQLSIWQESQLMRDMVLAVNLSARQLHETDFVTQIQRILTETGANPAKLKLELTESSVLTNIDESISKMLELQLLGIRFAIDDFGTGHSSLQYLKRLPLDQIKIDQSFVRDIATDPNDAVIVKTIISMSEAMGLNVIAEGVETPAQREFLIANGCHVFQGHLFGAAVTLAEFENLVRRLSL